MKEGACEAQRLLGGEEAVSTPPDGPGSCVQAHPPVCRQTLRKRSLSPGEPWLLKILKT